MVFEWVHAVLLAHFIDGQPLIRTLFAFFELGFFVFSNRVLEAEF